MNADHKYFINSIEKLVEILPNLKGSEKYENFINSMYDENGELIVGYNFLVNLGIFTFQAIESIEDFSKVLQLDFYILSVLPLYDVITKAKIVDDILIIEE